MIVIFDFDKTFYSGEKVFENIKSWVDEHRRDFFPNLTNTQYVELMKRNKYFLKAEIGSEIIAGIIKMRKKYPNLPIDTKGYWECQQKYIYDINLDNAEVVDVDFIKAFTRMIDCYIVSNSSPNHLNHYIKKIGLENKYFKQVISNRFELDDSTKQHYYQGILNQENIDAKELYVIGDTYADDLKPAENIGANTCLTTKSSLLKDKIIMCLQKAIIQEPKLEQYLLKKYFDDKSNYDAYNHYPYQKSKHLCKEERQILRLVGISEEKICQLEKQ